MRLKFLKKDLRRNKVTAAALFVFILLAALLAGSAVNIVSTLFGSVNNLFALSEAPHFLQMHVGDIDRDDIRQFAETNALVSDWLISEALTADGSAMHWRGDADADTASVIENYFVEQNNNFDYMLNLRNERIEVSAGEIAVPIYYMERQGLKIGESVTVKTRAGEMTFRISDFVRDAQMNPSIVSSKRFVVNGRDFAALRSVIGETEYSIEFRLTDEDRLSEFAAAYSEAELPNTGPTVDIALLMLLNALTDGITAAIVLLVGLLSVGIAFLCLRFAVLSALAEDYREIGAMKAIGIRQQDIRDIYLAKYVALAAGGCFFGYVLSLPVSRVFTANIALYIGEGNNGAWQHLLPILAVGLLFLITLLFCSLIFGKARQVSAVEALRTGSAGEAKNGFRRLLVSKSRLPINLHLGLKDLCGRPRTYMLLLFIFIAASFLIIVPLNLLTTLNSPAFVAYMGIGECDIRLDMQQSEDVAERFGEVRAALARDADIGRFSSFVTCRYGVIGAGGAAAEGIYVETGDYSVFPLAYSKGRAPISPADIALSALNARDLAKSVGDTVTLIVGGKQLSLTVCGIYQDITNGGRTAKAMLPYEPENALWYTVNADVNGGVSIRDKTAEYSARWSGVRVSHTTEYLAQTLGSTIGQVGRIVALTLTLATSVTILITAMFLKMLTVRDTSDIRVMKGLGFTAGNIRKQYITCMLATLFTGVIVGTFAANTLGQGLVGAFMSGMGVSEMRFIIRPLLAYIACPFALAGVVTLTTFAGTVAVGKQNPAGAITE